MLIWIKTNDSWGYVGVSKGETTSDIDNHISETDIEKILGISDDEIMKLNNTNYLTDELKDILISNGFTYKPNLCKSNCDVNAYCFEKNKL